jgi:hypothetical protein
LTHPLPLLLPLHYSYCIVRDSVSSYLSQHASEFKGRLRQTEPGLCSVQQSEKHGP